MADFFKLLFNKANVEFLLFYSFSFVFKLSFIFSIIYAYLRIPVRDSTICNGKYFELYSNRPRNKTP